MESQNARCRVCDIIIEGKSYTFKNLKTKFIINKNLSYNLKSAVYIIECSNYKKGIHWINSGSEY